MPKLARRTWGIPTVNSTIERNTLFPAPEQNQVVINLETGAAERWTGLAWASAWSLSLASQPGVFTPTLGPFNADATGATQAGDAINACATAAGVGATLFFPPGSTFLLDTVLKPLAGQTWVCYGATFKRKNQVSDITTAVYTLGVRAGSTPVTNGAQFRVGTTVSMFKAATQELNVHLIAGIVGNTLDLNGNMGVSIAAGATIVSSHELINSSAADVRVYGGTWDGNRANNNLYQRWEIHSTVHIISDRGRVFDLYIHDSQSDGAELGGAGIKFGNLDIIDSQGNGVHLGGPISQWHASNIRIVNANLSGTATGHADGGFIASDAVGTGACDGLYVENAISCIGSWDQDDDSEVHFNNVYGKNCTTNFIKSINNNLAFGRFRLSNFQATDCGPLSINQTADPGDPTAGGYKQLFVNGELLRTQVIVVGGRNICFDNVIVDYTGDTTTTCVHIARSKDISWGPGCQVLGGLTGMFVEGVHAGADNIRISGLFREQQVYGILLSPIAAGNKNWVLVAPQVITSASVPGGYKGIGLGNGCLLSGGMIDIGAGTYGVEFPNGGVGVNGAMAIGVVVRSPGGTPSMKMFGGSQNNFAVNNFVQQAISNSAGVSNTVADTYTIP
jgi:hypothetical protein